MSSPPNENVMVYNTPKFFSHTCILNKYFNISEISSAFASQLPEILPKMLVSWGCGTNDMVDIRKVCGLRR